MLLTGPPGWKDSSPQGDKITLDKAELERLNDIWRDVNSMVGRRNMGVRLLSSRHGRHNRPKHGVASARL